MRNKKRQVDHLLHGQKWRTQPEGPNQALHPQALRPKLDAPDQKACQAKLVQGRPFAFCSSPETLTSQRLLIQLTAPGSRSSPRAQWENSTLAKPFLECEQEHLLFSGLRNTQKHTDAADHTSMRWQQWGDNRHFS